jgi:hypothetical protein
MNLIRRITPDASTPGTQHNILLIPHLFYRADNTRVPAGHMRLFASRPGHGWCFYTYHRQASCDDWAMHRVWNFALFAIHHIEPGKKATDPAGWHITWSSLKLSKRRGEISLTWRKADQYHTSRKGH